MVIPIIAYGAAAYGVAKLSKWAGNRAPKRVKELANKKSVKETANKVYEKVKNKTAWHPKINYRGTLYKWNIKKPDVLTHKTYKKELKKELLKKGYSVADASNVAEYYRGKGVSREIGSSASLLLSSAATEMAGSKLILKTAGKELGILGKAAKKEYDVLKNKVAKNIFGKTVKQSEKVLRSKAFVKAALKNKKAASGLVLKSTVQSGVLGSGESIYQGYLLSDINNKKLKKSDYLKLGIVGFGSAAAGSFLVSKSYTRLGNTKSAKSIDWGFSSIVDQSEKPSDILADLALKESKKTSKSIVRKFGKVRSFTPTITTSSSSTSTSTNSIIPSITSSKTSTVTSTPSTTPTTTPTITPTNTPTTTPTPTPSLIPTPENNPTPTTTPTETNNPTPTETPTITETPSIIPTSTNTPQGFTPPLFFPPPTMSLNSESGTIVRGRKKKYVNEVKLASNLFKNILG